MKKKLVKVTVRFVKVLLFLCFLNSCDTVEIEQLNKENKNLIQKNDSLSRIIYFYEKQENEIRRQEKIRNSYSNYNAIETFKSHVDFYCKNCDYKDLRVQRYSDVSFDISMTKRSNADDVDHGWTGVVVRITFQHDGKYTIENLQGFHDFGCQ